MKSFSTLVVSITCLVSLIIAGAPPEDGDFPPSGSYGCGSISTVGESNSTNYDRCSNDPDNIHYEDSQKFVPYDAYYNGTLTLDYTPTNASDSCRALVADRKADLEIGQLAHAVDTKLTRSAWDNNTFFLGLASFFDNATDTTCISTLKCAPKLNIVSSSSRQYWTQAWTLSSTKNGDGYDISGNVTTRKTISGNGVFFSVPACARVPRGKSYSTPVFFHEDQVSMTGRITADRADLTFTLANLSIAGANVGAVLTYKFGGAAWKDGARLVTTGDRPGTQGKSKVTSAQEQATKAAGAKKTREKWLYPVIAGAVLLAVILSLVLCCLCCGVGASVLRRGKRGAAAQNGNQAYPVQPVNYNPAMQQHQ